MLIVDVNVYVSVWIFRDPVVDLTTATRSLAAPDRAPGDRSTLIVMRVVCVCVVRVCAVGLLQSWTEQYHLRYQLARQSDND